MSVSYAWSLNLKNGLGGVRGVEPRKDRAAFEGPQMYHLIFIFMSFRIRRRGLILVQPVLIFEPGRFREL